MRKLFLFSFIILLNGCICLTDDDFAVVASQESTTPSEYGQINVELISTWNVEFNFSAELISSVIIATLREYSRRFGPFSEESLVRLRNWTIYIVREDSTLWEATCWDPPGDLYLNDACAGSGGSTLFPYRTDTNQIAIRLGVYNRGCNDIFVYAHEVMHHVLWIERNYDDWHHELDVWENRENDVIQNVSINECPL